MSKESNEHEDKSSSMLKQALEAPQTQTQRKAS